MFPESAEVSETSAAVGALEGLLTRVGPVMTLKGTRMTELPPANTASVRLLASVDPNVCLHIGAVTESFLTVSTLEGFPFYMGSLVSPTTRTVGEGFPAVITCVGFHTGVNARVPFKLRIAGESFVTLVTLENLITHQHCSTVRREGSYSIRTGNGWR